MTELDTIITVNVVVLIISGTRAYDTGIHFLLRFCLREEDVAGWLVYAREDGAWEGFCTLRTDHDPDRLQDPHLPYEMLRRCLLLYRSNPGNMF